jgi:excisionase family DNA binding protein
MAIADRGSLHAPRFPFSYFFLALFSNHAALSSLTESGSTNYSAFGTSSSCVFPPHSAGFCRDCKSQNNEKEILMMTRSTYSGSASVTGTSQVQDDALLTFKEAMAYLRVSRSTLYRLMWSGQLTGHKVGSTWRFYREDLRACVGREIVSTPVQNNDNRVLATASR